MKLGQLQGKVIRFNKAVLNTEDDFSPGQRVRVLSVARLGTDFETAELYVDFKEFEEANKALAEHNYYGKNGPTLAWHETNSYPKDCRTKVFEMVESIEKNTATFDLDEEPGMLLTKVQQRILALLDEEGVIPTTQKAVSAGILLILKDSFPNA